MQPQQAMVCCGCFLELSVQIARLDIIPQPPPLIHIKCPLLFKEADILRVIRCRYQRILPQTL